MAVCLLAFVGPARVVRASLDRTYFEKLASVALPFFHEVGVEMIFSYISLLSEPGASDSPPHDDPPKVGKSKKRVTFAEEVDLHEAQRAQDEAQRAQDETDRDRRHNRLTQNRKRRK